MDAYTLCLLAELHWIQELLLQVRTRTQDLQKTLLQAIFDLETAPERYDWSEVFLNCLLVVSGVGVFRCALYVVAHGSRSSTCWSIGCRSNVLERFAVMNSQLNAITAQIVPLLEHYVVHPRVSKQSTYAMFAHRNFPSTDASLICAHVLKYTMCDA